MLGSAAGLGQLSVAAQADVPEQVIDATGELVQEGMYPSAQGGPIGGEAMLLEHPRCLTINVSEGGIVAS